MKRTDQLVVFQHRDHNVRPNAAMFDGFNRPRAASFNVVLVFRKVCNVDGLFVCYRLTYKVFRNKAYPQTLARLDQGRRRIMGREDVRLLTIPPVDVPKGGVAKPNGFLKHGGKYRLKIAGGATDNLEHLRRGSLLLQRLREVGCAFGEVGSALTEFVEQPRVLNGDDGLGSEILYQCDLFVAE